MTSTTVAGSAANPRLETGPYILRSLIQDVALSADGQNENTKITCVEAWRTYIISESLATEYR